MQSSIINEIIAVFPNILLHREEEYCSVADLYGLYCLRLRSVQEILTVTAMKKER